MASGPERRRGRRWRLAAGRPALVARPGVMMVFGGRCDQQAHIGFTLLVSITGNSFPVRSR